MNIDAAREFLALARCLNFTEAATSLNITQPALSKHIIALEKEFNCRLLDRNRKGVNLTESGKLLFQSATVIVDEYDKAREAINALRDRVTVRLVGNLDDEDDSTLATLATVVARQNNLANVVWEPFEGDPLQKLLAGEADIMIGYVDPEYLEELGVRAVPFVTRSLVAVVNADHPFALREGISWADLLDQTMLKFVSGKTDPAWSQLERLSKRRGFSPKTRTIPASNDFEFFSTPLKNDVLIWKSTERNLGLLLDTGRRCGVPIVDDDARLVSYAIFMPGNEQTVEGFVQAVHEARVFLNNRKSHRQNDE